MDESFEQLAQLRPEERRRLIKVSRLSDRQWDRLEAVIDLSEDRWRLLTESADIVRSIQVVSKITKWFAIGLAGFFFGVVALGDAFVRFKAFFVSGSPK